MILAAYWYRSWRRRSSRRSLYARRNAPITGHTEWGWSLNGSLASIEASSSTHAPCSAEEWRPRVSLTVGWRGDGSSLLGIAGPLGDCGPAGRVRLGAARRSE